MKQITQKAIGFFFATFLLFSFTQCTKSALKDEDVASANKMGDKALNLTKEYRAVLSSLNNSGVTGMATLTLNGNMLTVNITASGLEPNRLHPQHIHGFKLNTRNSTCPTMAADSNGDGIVDLGEGLPSYGPVLLELEPFPTAPDGTINYTNTFEISSDLLPLQNRAIVLHGMTVGGEYITTLPVACGMIQSWNGNGRN